MCVTEVIVQQEGAASADGGERMRVLSVEVFSDHKHQNTRPPDSSSNTLTSLQND